MYDLCYCGTHLKVHIFDDVHMEHATVEPQLSEPLGTRGGP